MYHIFVLTDEGWRYWRQTSWLSFMLWHAGELGYEEVVWFAW